ncbi:uncharacterized protein LOC101888947 isoform X2 [Musca domestica]|nr:uncharacterized protein LOC101888947 isoform X2 [Musca domestica]XP_058986565.1 uncharacterized protein LOC101888947 isoform X2 [Musca domestica]XP_058986566.1 uncharacterized protein LOC101888947 isoform X2 [Musca domestica]XP_058986567.1 uncharacterized protein LOC101888947 isoform X2 [Musca domestica]
MGFSVQNSETGEVSYIQTDADKVQQLSYDAETGEPIIGKIRVRYIKQKNFQIPKKLLRGSPCEEFEKEMLGRSEEIYQEPCASISKEPPASTVQTVKPKLKCKTKTYNRDDFINMEGVSNDIILGYNKSNYRMLLLPTLFFFNVYAAVIVMILEIFFHFWAHFKNGVNMNKDIYYRSPLHVMTSQFCARCRSESEMEANIFRHLNKQMRLARQSKTLKNVSKAIG